MSAATRHARYAEAPQQCLNFLPLPQGHGSLRRALGVALPPSAAIHFITLAGGLAEASSAAMNRMHGSI